MGTIFSEQHCIHVLHISLGSVASYCITVLINVHIKTSQIMYSRVIFIVIKKNSFSYLKPALHLFCYDIFTRNGLTSVALHLF